ncbi:hypothetical protein ARAM_002979 [Aspergillus rambellii]|uniref:SGNH hydrolase-type esterase domain-containing protein n=1 Tax=Aspergillus rambellii TaxID=308745 RepID=A0A0F8UET8_9EURO|nr:hypothetical protein ARAM_002979 [Aspergillus rambellii]
MLALLLLAFISWSQWVSATILQNGQVRENPYPGQAVTIELDGNWRNYTRDAPEISYKGRWDSYYTSWWSVPGIKFAFTGEKLAIGFGQNTSDGVLVAYRLGGMNWQFSNVTADSTCQFIGPWTPGLNETDQAQNKTFELRVQITGISVTEGSNLVAVPNLKKSVEIIGDSLASGMHGTYEGLSGWAFGFAAGLGNVEYSITAYPGICLVDRECYNGSSRGMTYAWYYTSDVGVRAQNAYGDNPEPWNFTSQQSADLAVIDLGTNDARYPNEIPGDHFVSSYVELINTVHKVWPEAQVVLMSLWGNFERSRDTYIQRPMYQSAVQQVQAHFQKAGFVHYFDTRGILQHNDIAPLNHPTDIGHIKVASHLMQWVQLKLGWEFGTQGEEIQSGTTYWNNQSSY